MQDDFGT